MTELYIISTNVSDTGKVSLEKLVAALPENIYKRVTDTKNERARLERSIAYSLLYYATGGAPVAFSEHGKPYLPSGEKYISVSHTGSACVVAVTDDGEVGVDIEEVSEEALIRAKKAKARFFPFAYLSPAELSDLVGNEITIHYMTVSEEGIAPAENEGYMVTGFSGPLYFWVGAEAILKADGRGFLVADEVEKISYRARHYSTIAVKFGGSLCFLSLAVMK